MADKNTANIGFEKQIWDAACVLWGHIPAAEYRKVIVGLIFLRYISSAFKKRYMLASTGMRVGEMVLLNRNDIDFKIAMINDSQVLDNYSAKEIKSRAKLVGVDIDVKDKKIVIPNDKEKIKIILGFLDEEAYKGPFSQKTFLANSKRQVH